MSKLEVDQIDPQSGTTLTLGTSGDTVSIPAGVSLSSGATLTAPVLAGSASSAGKVLFKEDTDNGTNSVTLIGPAATGDVIVTLPAATDTLVGKATTDTLTNKTINGSQLINATIPLAKLAAGTDGNIISYDANGAVVAVATGSAAQVLTSAGAGQPPAFANATVPDNAITLAKMAPGTDGNIISYDTSGNPVAVATGSAGQFLKSAGAGAVPSFATIPAGGANTPAFYAQSASNQGWADDATAKIVFGTEVYDTNNTFADSKFTPGVAGTYKIYCGIQVGTATTAYGAVAHCRLQLYKNGSTFIRADYDSRGSSGGNGFVSFTLNGNWSVVADDNDYYEIYVYADVESSTPVAYALGGGVNFGAFKLIT